MKTNDPIYYVSLVANLVLLFFVVTFAFEIENAEHRHANTLSAKNAVIAKQSETIDRLSAKNEKAEAALADANERVRELQDKLRAARYQHAKLRDELRAAESERRRIEHHLAVKYDLDDDRAAELAGYFYDAKNRAEERYGVVLDPTVLVALTHAESRFDSRAVSWAGAVGIMQVVPRFHLDRFKFLDVREDLLRPSLNIRAGVFVYALAKARYGTVRAAVRAYHGGANGVTDPKPSTLAYEDAIFDRLRRLGA